MWSLNVQELKSATMFTPFTPPITYDDAQKQAIGILNQMTMEEKISLIGGHNVFFTKGFEKFGIPALYLSDATQGVNIRSELDDQLEKSVAFPSPIALTSTWNKDLASNYAKAIGEECRAGEIAVLLGPGMNIYRISQNGRNFEYFGEGTLLLIIRITKEEPQIRSLIIGLYGKFICLLLKLELMQVLWLL